MLADDHIWHFWIALPLAIGAILTVVALVGLYFFRVTRTRYPRQPQQ